MENVYKINPETQNILKVRSKLEYLDNYFKQKLLYHTADVWDQIQLALIDPENILGLKPMLHYEKYYREEYKNVETFPEVIDKIIELSDKEQIKKYDVLVDEFNADLENIKKDHDSQKLQYFLNQFTETIKENKIKN